MEEKELIGFVKFRDAALKMLEENGAFRALELMSKTEGYGDTGVFHSWLDRLVKMGDVEEMPRKSWGQFKVYASPKTHNY